MIRLFDDNAVDFSTNGIGPLPSAMSATVTEELNGVFELEMVYPVDGKRYSEIHNRSILVCQPNPFSNPQAFRVYSISKPMDGLVTINAAHISYDLNGIPIRSIEAGSAAGALSILQPNAVVNCPFTFWTDLSKTGDLIIPTPTSIRAVLLGQRDSVLSVYGGEFEWDNFTVRLYTTRGNDKGVQISYGKNLTDISQEENFSEVYTGVYPYYYSDQDGLVEAPGKIVNSETEFNYSNIAPLDVTSKWEEKPTPEQVQEAAVEYMKENNIGIPKVSMDISFVQLSQSKEYELYGLLDQVQLGDTVTVRFDKLGIFTKARCVSYKYNVLTDRYDTLTLGEPTDNLATSISQQNQYIHEEVQSSMNALNAAIDNATQQITGGLGGYVVIRSSTGGKQPDEILIMDTPDVLTAKKIWRWNKNGLGYSSTGYNGPYSTAITQDGAIVADFITTGSLIANIIKSGVITAFKGNTIYDLDAGTIQMGSTSGAHIKITDNMIRWYLKGGTTSDDYATGVFYSIFGNTWIGANSANSYYGWMPAGTPGTGDNNRNGYVGLRISHTNFGGDVAHFNTKSVECGDNFGNGQGYFESYDVKVNGKFIGPMGANLVTLNTKQYGNISLTGTGSASPIAFDNGSGVLDETGKCYLFLTDEFASTVSANVTPQWHITATSESEKPLTVQKDGLSAVVTGEPGATFDWLCIMPQKGCETLYCEPLDFDMSDSMDRKDYTADAELDNVENFERNLNDEVLIASKENAYIEDIWPEQAERS